MLSVKRIDGVYKSYDEENEIWGEVNDVDVPVINLLGEWSNLIDELSEKEIALYKWKECYNIKSDEIIKNTNFKELYGANNADVRKTHVKNELTDWYDTIKNLEFSIDYIVRRISFLKELIRTKTLLTECGCVDGGCKNHSTN